MAVLSTAASAEGDHPLSNLGKAGSSDAKPKSWDYSISPFRAEAY
jgi:hypothetical protein